MTESWGNHVTIAVDGVMRSPNDVAPIIAGLLLYKSLVKTHRVSLIIDDASKEKTQYWLMVNGFIDHTNEIYWEADDPSNIVERRVAQIGRIRANGPLALMLEADTEVVTKTLELGIPAFLFVHPQYIHPDFRPDAQFEVTPWETLLNEQIRQRVARASDERLKEFNHDST